LLALRFDDAHELIELRGSGILAARADVRWSLVTFSVTSRRLQQRAGSWRFWDYVMRCRVMKAFNSSMV
jgi:hypothetical protein